MVEQCDVTQVLLQIKILVLAHTQHFRNWKTFKHKVSANLYKGYILLNGSSRSTNKADAVALNSEISPVASA